MLDIEKLRVDTPGVDHVLHLNNAGAALPPKSVIEAQTAHILLEGLHGGYEAKDMREAELSSLYDAIGRLINASADEIAVVENATVAWDMAFYSIPFKVGDRILTAQVEYGANYVAYLQIAKRTGAKIEVIPSTPHGEICVESLEKMMDERVKLISVTHVPTNGGLVNPAAEIGRIAKKYGVPYMLDACQSVGQMPIDIQAIGCDMLSATSRKYLRGPRGAGFLYVRKGLLETLHPPIIDHYAANWVEPDRYELRPDAKRFENWENNYAARLGLLSAIEYADRVGVDAGWERIRTLAAELRQALSRMRGIEVLDIGTEKCGIVTFTKAGRSAAQMKTALRRQKINVSVSSNQSTLLDQIARNLQPSIRASIHYYNTRKELDLFLKAVHAI